MLTTEEKRNFLKNFAELAKKSDSEILDKVSSESVEHIFKEMICVLETVFPRK